MFEKLGVPFLRVPTTMSVLGWLFLAAFFSGKKKSPIHMGSTTLPISPARFSVIELNYPKQVRLRGNPRGGNR